MLKSDTGITSIRTYTLSSKPTAASVNLAVTEHSNEQYNECSSVNHTSSVTPLTIKHFCCNEENYPSPSYHDALQGDSSGECSDAGGSRGNPLLIDDNSSSSNFGVSHDHHEASHDQALHDHHEASHDQALHDHHEASHDQALHDHHKASHDQASHDYHEASHDYSEVLHNHIRASHDHIPRYGIHISSSSKHKHTEASHDGHMSHTSKNDKQKVASLVVCVLNPYLKKGKIANKVMCI